MAGHSILSTLFADIFVNKMPFDAAVSQAATAIDKWATNVVKTNPQVQTLADDALSDVKQVVSTSVSFAQTDLAPVMGTALTDLTTLVDGLLVSVAAKAGPAGVAVEAVASPLVNTGISQLFQVLQGALSHMETEALAWASAPPAPPAAQAGTQPIA
jgi:hypothetical protein